MVCSFQGSFQGNTKLNAKYMKAIHVFGEQFYRRHALRISKKNLNRLGVFSIYISSFFQDISQTWNTHFGTCMAEVVKQNRRTESVFRLNNRLSVSLT